MPNITEGQLTFVFPDDWGAISYDEEGGFYKTTIERAPFSFKAMDILTVSNINKHMWIEVKDCINHESANQPRFCIEDPSELSATREWIKEQNWKRQVSARRAKPFIADEVAQKTVDTLTGLIYSMRNEDETLAPFHPAINNQSIHIVLFLTLNYRPRDYNRLAMRIQGKIRSSLKTLNINQVTVCDEQTIPDGWNWTVSRR